MSRDFAKRNAPGKRRSTTAKGSAPAWLWFIIGAILGAFGMALVFWSNEQTKTPAVTETPKPSPTNDSKSPKPRFDFYKLLQESEVIVPATEKIPEGDKTPEPVVPNIEFILQVGSFPNRPEADKYRAELILLNLDAHIETVEIHKGEIWHRVMVGPFDSQQKLASARSILVTNQYSPLVMKRAKSKK
ncbi:MAG: SPOR domain-containing protein [Pseudomonadota bacterium]